MDQELRLTLRKLDGNACEFLLEGVTPAYANAIRRAILADVPMLAIDEVVVVKNDSVLFDEILAHRLALVPLKVDEATYDVLLECSEEGRREGCVASFALEVEADRQATVFSGHLKFAGFTGISGIPAGVEVKPVSDLIPIVKLAPGQGIVLEAYARMGVGKESAKWQPVSVAAYKYYPRIIARGGCGERCEKCAEVCPKGILRSGRGRLEIVEERIEECTMCRACEEACPEVVKVAWDDRKLIFRVEGLGCIPISKVVEVALKRLVKRIDRLTRELELRLAQTA